MGLRNKKVTLHKLYSSLPSLIKNEDAPSAFSSTRYSPPQGDLASCEMVQKSRLVLVDKVWKSQKNRLAVAEELWAHVEDVWAQEVEEVTLAYHLKVPVQE